MKVAQHEFLQRTDRYNKERSRWLLVWARRVTEERQRQAERRLDNVLRMEHAYYDNR